MNHMPINSRYGELSESTTLTIQRVLPGPIDRVWDYLTKSDLRRQWLAAGDMALNPDASFQLTWRNDELTSPPGARPEGFGEEHHMTCRITEIDPPHIIAFTWGTGSHVRFSLEEHGDDVMLTLVHARLVDRGSRLNVSAGWHAHLDILLAKLSGETPAPFWDSWKQLRGVYDTRIPN
jgi:uncharacterized protein YndB with AHSA1/START domain